ncbi:PAS domain S-box protein [Magnetospira sp. QH-2]|uniref:PAS domain S-box protein n=1 Tax=Magnetospira sp. (strain QH-2) TaxID=1288970 RepID=UPI00130DC99E|nr:PAS domain S-box protein [Magnetospira sp. QH-2]
MRDLLLGGSFGGLAILAITYPITIAPHVIVDGRHVMIITAAIYGNWRVALLTALAVIGYRVGWVGGPIALTAFAASTYVTIVSMLVARVWPSVKKNPLMVAALAVAIQFTALFALIFVPDPDVALKVFKQSAVPLSLAVGVGGLVLSYLLRQDDHRRNVEARLRASQQRHKGIVDNTVDGIIVIDEHGIVAEYNTAATTIFGYSAEEVIGHNINMLMPEPDKGRHDSYLSNFIRTGDAKIIGIGREVTARHKSGREFAMDLAVSEARIGGRRYFTGVVRDITERRAAAEELSRQKSLFQGIINHMADALVMTDPERRIVLINPAVSELFGYDMNDLSGQTTAVLYESTEEFERQGRLRFNMTAEEKSRPYVVRYKDKNNRVFSGETVGTAIRAEDGLVLGYLGIIRDITDRLAVEEDLRHSESRLKEAQRIARMGSWEWDIETGEIYWSEEIYRIFGRDAETFTPSYDAFQEQIHPDDRAAVQASNERAKNGQPHDVEHRILLPDGGERYVHEQGQMHFAEDGSPSRMTGTVHDITDRKNAELALQRHNRGLEALNEIAALRDVSEEEQLNRALKVGSEHLGLEIGIVSRVNGDDYEVMQYIAPEGVPLEPGQHFPLGNTYCEITLREDDVVAIDYMGGSSHAGHPCYEAFQLEAYIGVPYFIGNQLAGTVNYSSPTPYRRQFDDGDHAFLRMMARWVGAVLERQTTQHNLALSESRMNVSQSFANIGTWDWNIQDGGLYWSERIGPLFGYPKGDLETSYENFLGAVHPDDRQDVVDAVNACVETGAEYNIEHRVVWPDGTVRWLLEKGDVVRDGDGKPLQMLGVVQDINRVKSAEAELTENKEALEDLYENAPSAYVTMDVESGLVVRHNQALTELLGYSRDELATMNVLEFYAEGADGLERAKTVMHLLKQGRATQNVELQMQRKDGKPIWVSLSVSPRTNDSGQVVESRSIVVDITKRKQVQQDLEKAREAADAANAAKSEFLSAMSHELRTPLNAILGFAQLLDSSRREQLSEKQKRHVDQIHKSGKHLLDLINEVLDLAKIEAGKLSVSIESISLSLVLQECLALVESLARDRDIDLVYNDDRNGSLAVLADYTRLRQILLNLLSNAIKYNKKGGTVTVSVQEPVDEFIRISITDTGPGIAPEKQEALFEPFNRLGAESSEIEGTGIGLALTRKMVEHLGGRVGFSSTLGEGSTFWIEVAVGEDRVVVNTTLAGSLPYDTFQDGTLPQRVLYVEDNPANQTLMEEIFDELPGLTLTIAKDAEVGLSLAKSEEPEVILMDINLPGISGLDALKILKTDKATLNIPVIALSADATLSTQRMGMAAGFTAYLTKPVEIDDLMATLRSALGGKKE